MNIAPPDGLERLAKLEQSLARLDAATLEPQPESDDAPVFLASIGWRSGSTMMQRTLMTDPSILVWGEPMAHLLFVHQLTEPLFGVTEDWPNEGHWLSHRPDIELTKDWVATLTPDAGHLKAGYRAFFDNWLGAPARQRGFTRWGVKQVRWTGEDGLLLRWLYPKAKFVMIMRHPVSAYLSMRNFGFDPPRYGHLVMWPDSWVASLDDYARFWNHMALTWGALVDKLGVTWIRYEDFTAGRVGLDELSAKLGLSLHSEAARAKVGGSKYEVGITVEERDRINALTAQGRALFLYDE